MISDYLEDARNWSSDDIIELLTALQLVQNPNNRLVIDIEYKMRENNNRTPI